MTVLELVARGLVGMDCLELDVNEALFGLTVVVKTGTPRVFKHNEVGHHTCVNPVGNRPLPSFCRVIMASNVPLLRASTKRQTSCEGPPS